MTRVLALSFLILSTVPFSASLAQESNEGASFRSELFPNTPAESYLRYLQSIGRVPLYPWSSRSFSPRELDRLIPKDSAHPWSARFRDESQLMSGFRYDIIAPSTTFRYNTAFAYGSNDGPVWAGRGLTTAVQLGVNAKWGPVSLTLAPMAFRAQNSAYEILTMDRAGRLQFADPVFAGVDRPQRFGDTPYTQLDPGQSTIRVDLPFVAFGISTANQAWGPGQELPVILGTNAAGFPHIFLGSSEPLDIYIAKIHGKVFWGELFQSGYSTVTGPDHYVSRAEPGTRRFATGFIGTMQPRGITGLEIGAARFFHSVWPASGIPRSYYTKFLQGFLKEGLKPDNTIDPENPDGENRGISDNQLVSVFARWVLPHSGFELHGEYGRDDHSYDTRDLIQEPDHAKVYSLGARKVLRVSGSSLTAARFEIMNFQLPQFSRYRGEGEVYVHGLIRQGHTQRGQLLGADVGVGTGAGSVVAVDRFTESGRWTANMVSRRSSGEKQLPLRRSTDPSLDRRDAGARARAVEVPSRVRRYRRNHVRVRFQPKLQRGCHQPERSARRSVFAPLMRIQLAWTMLTEMLVMISSLLVLKVAASLLGAAGFGEYALGRRSINLLYLPLVMGLGIAAPRYIAIVRAGALEAYSESSLVLATLSAGLLPVFIVIVLLNAAPGFASLTLFGTRALSHIIPASTIALAGIALHSMVYAVYRGQSRMGHANLLQIANSAIVPLAAFAFATGGAATVLLATGAAWIAFGMIALIHIAVSERQNWKGFASVGAHLQLLLRYGLPRVPGEFALVGLFAIPALLAVRTHGIVIAGQFSAAMSILGIVAGVFGPVGLVILPRASAQAATGDFENLRRMVLRILGGGILLAAAGVATGELVIPYFVRWYFGAEFLSAIPIFRACLLGAIPYVAYVLMRNILDALDVKALNSRNLIISLVVLTISCLAKTSILWMAGSLVGALSLLGALTLRDTYARLRPGIIRDVNPVAA